MAIVEIYNNRNILRFFLLFRRFLWKYTRL